MAKAMKRAMATDGDNMGDGYGEEAGGQAWLQQWQWGWGRCKGHGRSCYDWREGCDGSNGPWFVFICVCVERP